MPELLIELLSEEIPARMQAGAAVQLERLMTDALKEAGLKRGASKAYVTPRRLALVIEDVPAATEDVREERKGPRVGAPDAALQGFLRATGLTKSELQTKSDGKGEFYIALIERKGRPAVEVIAETIPAIVAGFHWPKSMRWGAGTLRWVRPLQSVLCVFGGAPLPFAIELGDGELVAGDETVGHRFLAPQKFRVRNFEEYREKLARAHVMLDAEERKALIWRDLTRLAAAEGLEPIEDAGLMEEVAGLVEDPVVLIGKIDESFLDVPPEVLSTAMHAHQKYFSLRFKAAPSPSPLPAGGERVRAGEGQGRFAPRFGVVANLRAKDGGKGIVAGNERVLRARLSDARFFWDQDLRVRLSDRLAGLKGMTFHARRGSMLDKVIRLEKHAGELATKLYPGDSAVAGRAKLAAKLAKADLTSGMVGEFPELQGLMGRYYALRDKDSEIRDSKVADAIRDHYKPAGANDSVPSQPESVVVALADKLDSLVGLWYAGERPTGSKDPLALRRLAIGIIRIILESERHLPLRWAIKTIDFAYEEEPEGLVDEEPTESLLAFIADRLKVYLRDRGARHDLVDAVFSLPGQDDLLLIVKRVEALGKFLATEDGKGLLTAHDRAANILKIEEKKDGKPYTDDPETTLLKLPQEQALHAAIAALERDAVPLIERTDFEGAMRALAKLRAPVDTFFDKVTVNDKDAGLRANRLKLLALIRRAMSGVADFSKIEGGA